MKLIDKLIFVYCSLCKIGQELFSLIAPYIIFPVKGAVAITIVYVAWQLLSWRLLKVAKVID